MKSILRLFTLSALIAGIGYAVPPYPGKVNFRQKDGRTFSGRLKGDEWFHWIEDRSGHVILYNRKTQRYEYARVLERNGTAVDLVPSGIPVAPTRTSRASAVQAKLPVVDKKTLHTLWKEKRRKAALRHKPSPERQRTNSSPR